MNSTVGCLTFPFFTMSWYLALVLLGSNMIKKGYDWVPWLFMFLRTPLSSACAPSKAPFKRVRHGLQCISHPWHIWHRCVPYNIDVSYGTWAQNSGGPTVHWVLVRLEGKYVCYGSHEGYVNGVASYSWHMHVFLLLMCIPCCPTELHLQNTCSKLKSLRISTWQQQSY